MQDRPAQARTDRMSVVQRLVAVQFNMQIDEDAAARAPGFQVVEPVHAGEIMHVFSGDGYSSGYYSYMWSEVMDADAFDAFTEAGDPFDPTLAKLLEDTVLSSGGSVEPDALYTAFRGRMPGVDALLRGRGLAA